MSEGSSISKGKRERFYHSQAWKKARAAYLGYRKAIDGGLCEICGNELGDTVHHKVWLTDSNLDDPDIALSYNNFQLVCRDCHAKEKDPAKKGKARYRFDGSGNIISNETD